MIISLLPSFTKKLLQAASEQRTAYQFAYRLLQGTLVLLAAVFCAGMAPRVSSEAVEEHADHFKAALLGYFKSYYLLPIIIPAGQDTGDVYDPEWWLLKDRRTTCFPRLAQPKYEKTDLPGVVNVSAEEAGLALGLGRMLKLDLSASAIHTTQIRFRELSVRQVSQGELKRNLSAACSYLRPIVDELRQEVGVAKPYAIIGRVVRGKRDVFLGVSEKVDLNGAVNSIDKLLEGIGFKSRVKVRGLTASESAALGFERRQGIILQGDEVLPIAFTPAFIPDAILSSTQTRGEGDAAEVQWRAFEPERDPAQAARFKKLVEAVGGSE